MECIETGADMNDEEEAIVQSNGPLYKTMGIV